MRDNGLEILKTFTRKLANCRYKVSLDNIIKYMNEGKFGYTVDKEADVVVTNDFVFADDIATLMSHIRAIFKAPHIFLSREEVVQNIQTARNMDNETAKLNYKDDKLWRVKEDSEAALEYAHAFVHEDNLAIYENRFLCALIDIIYNVINKKLNDLSTSFANFNNMILGKDYLAGLAPESYIDYSDNHDGLPVILSNKQPLVNVIASLQRSKQIIAILRTKELYLACKRSAPFDLTTLKPTNILLHDKQYNYCYRFYLNYLNRDPVITTERKMLLGFFQVNTFIALSELGFLPEENSQDILINNSANMRFDNISFKKEPFTVYLSMPAEFDFLMTIKDNVDNSTSKILFKLLNVSETPAMLDFVNIDDYADKLAENLPEGIMRQYVVTDMISNRANVISIDPSSTSNLDNIIMTIKSCTLIAEGASSIHTKYCPVCGSSLVAPYNDDVVCATCEAHYHIFPYANKDIVWFKKLPKMSAVKVGINEEMAKQDFADAPAIAESVETEVAAAPAEIKWTIKKSFVAKMSQSKRDIVDFYNEIKNYFLSYKKVYTRISWGCDTFSNARLPKIKLAFKGKTLVAFFALNPADFVDTKYYVHDNGNVKKYQDTPLMIKIKSDRGVQHAKELADMVFANLDKKNNFVPEVYKFPKKSDKQLLEEGLAKKVKMNI